MIIQYNHIKPHMKVFLLLLIPALMNQKVSMKKKKKLKEETSLLYAAGFALLGSDGASYCDWDYGWVLCGCNRQVMFYKWSSITFQSQLETLARKMGQIHPLCNSWTFCLQIFHIFFISAKRVV